MLLFTNLVSQNYCDVLLHTGPPSWTTYKLIMYLILTRRAQESFDKSAFAYSSVKIRIWMILLITWSTLNIICNVFTSTFYISSNPHEIPQCDVELDPPLLISMILLDLVGGFGSAYLMINPLLQINRMRKQTGQQISIKFQNIAHKQAILSGISIITSWFAMVMIILTDNMHLVWVSLDLVISTLTVILIYDWNKWLFEKMCCCIVKDKREMNNDNIDLESVAASDGNEPQKDFIEYEQVEQTSSV